jgi:hypothetical protein
VKPAETAVAKEWLPTADVPLLPDSRPCRLATISHQPHYSLTAASELSRLNSKADSFIKPQNGLHREQRFQQFYCCDHMAGVSHCLAMDVLAEPFSSSSHLSGSAISPFRRHVTIQTIFLNSTAIKPTYPLLVSPASQEKRPSLLPQCMVTDTLYFVKMHATLKTLFTSFSHV